MELQQAIDRIRACTVQVIFFAFSRDRFERLHIKKERLGSGFFVNDDGYILTANHVHECGIKYMEKYRDVSDRVELCVGLSFPNIDEDDKGLPIVMSGNTMIEKVELVDTDDFHDLCLLKLERNPFKNQNQTKIYLRPGVPLRFLHDVPSLYLERPEDGAPIGLSGFSLDSSVLVTTTGHIASAWSSIDVEESVPGHPELTRSRHVPVYHLDCETYPGNSGGPVYLVENASIIGMLSACESSPIWDKNFDYDFEGGPLFSSGLGIVIPSRNISDMLIRNNVNYAEYRAC